MVRGSRGIFGSFRGYKGRSLYLRLELFVLTVVRKCASNRTALQATQTEILQLALYIRVFAREIL